MTLGEVIDLGRAHRVREAHLVYLRARLEAEADLNHPLEVILGGPVRGCISRRLYPFGFDVVFRRREPDHYGGWMGGMVYQDHREHMPAPDLAGAAPPR